MSLEAKFTFFPFLNLGITFSVGMCLCMYVHARTCHSRSTEVRGKHWESVLSYFVCPREQTQVAKLGDNAFIHWAILPAFIFFLNSCKASGAGRIARLIGKDVEARRTEGVCPRSHYGMCVHGILDLEPKSDFSPSMKLTSTAFKLKTSGWASLGSLLPGQSLSSLP